MTFQQAVGENALHYANVLPADAKKDYEVYLAKSDDRSVAGYVALGFVPARPFACRALFWMEVHPSRRKTGLGKKLLERVIASIPESGPFLLTSAQMVELGSEGSRFLEGRGFRLALCQHYWEVSNQAIVDLYKDLHEKQMARGKIPVDAKIVPLSEVSPEAIYSLVAHNMGFSPADTLERLRGGPAGYSRTLSKVLVVGERPMGAILATSGGTFATIHANVLCPSFRGGWASLMLKMAFCSNLLERGFSNFRFHADPVMHPDTDKTARRAGGRLLKSMGSYAWER